MPELIHLDPHDPLPSGRNYLVVFRHLGEDDPRAVVTEITGMDAEGHALGMVAAHPDGSAMTFEEAVTAAEAEARRHGIPKVYALNRTSGAREQDILRHGGDHSVHMEQLEDTDPEDGEQGTDLRDRTHDSGFLR